IRRLLRPNIDADSRGSVELIKILALGISNVRLASTLLIGCANFECVRSRPCDLPGVAPRSPDHGLFCEREISGLPRTTSVNLYLNLSDPTVSSPGDALHAVCLEANLFPFRRPKELRVHLHARDWLPFAVGSHSHIFFRLKVSLEWLPQHFHTGQPFHRVHSIPARHQRPQREPVLRGQGFTVHLVTQKRRRIHTLLERDAAGEAGARPHSLASTKIRPIEDYRSCVRPRASLFQ